MINRFMLALIALVAVPATAAGEERRAPPPSLQSGTVAEAAAKLSPGQYLWAPQIAPDGPVLLVVSLKNQRAVVYRNGVPIGISTVSTGRPGYETPTGVFVILQKRVDHYSNIYDNAPMPFMQRLTWGGIALHAGQLPGYPASHGCVRLPHDFARLLYGVTRMGMTVVITDQAALPRLAPAQTLLGKAGSPSPTSAAPFDWSPERAPDGPISIVISTTDRRMMVLRQGTAIGSFPIDIDGSVQQPSAYLLDGVVEGKRSWVRIALAGQEEAELEQLRGRIRLAEEHRRLVDPVVKIGTTVVVTADSLETNSAVAPRTLVESDRAD